MHPLSYFCFLLLSAVEFSFLGRPGWLSFLPLAIIFTMIPLLDYLRGVDTRNPNADQETSWTQRYVWMPAGLVYTASHFAILYFGIRVTMEATWLETIGTALSVGIYTGGLGITVAHEFSHKQKKFSRFLSNSILVSVWYQHFYVEHIRGHHFNVASPDDPASAPRGMNAYRFLVRSLWGSYIHAFGLEAKRLKRKWDLRNQVVIGTLSSLLLTIGIGLLGTKALVFFLLQAFIAMTLLELVNYVEHYGLRRQPLANGRYEKIQPHHSWNSSHWFSNVLLFNLQRHSDHHASANLPYTVLKHHDHAPQLPSGYTGVILLALCPPLWFRIMDRRLDSWQNQAGRPPCGFRDRID